MDQYFYESTGETVTIPHSSNEERSVYQPPEQDEFDFSNTHHEENKPSTMFSYESVEQPSQLEQDQTASRVKQEEQSVQLKLREKADQEYQLKQAKREEGRKQLQQFMDKKERELKQKKQQNRQAEERLLERMSKLNAQAGWNKVVASIKTKQGEHAGKKDISRMRESILHRYEDEGGK